MEPKNLNLKQVAAELNIDVPIMAIRAPKDGYELHLYGGRVVTYNPKRQAADSSKAGDAGETSQAQQLEPEPSGSPESTAAPEKSPPAPLDKGGELESWTVAELRKAAAHMGIKNASRLTKAQLIQSLTEE